MAFFTSTAFSIIVSLLIVLSPFFLRKQQSVSSLSGLTTTFGILGTFLGIFVGLISFNVADIESSVPLLLEGLKTAFLTSIAGMTAGVTLKIWPQLYGIKVTEDESKEGTEAVITLLRAIKEGNEVQISSQREMLGNIQKSLVGDGETTVLTQLQKIRTNFADKQDEMILEFRAFAKNMAENNSKALIEALAQVMRDFNAKINEQFGENFKQLNQAVERILVWQEKYKDQVDQMIATFEKSLVGIEKSDKHLTSIRSQSEGFAKIAESLKTTLDQLQDQRKQAEAGVQEFASIAKEAKSAIPIIKTEINKLTTEFTNTVSAALAEIGLSIAKVKDTVTQQSSTLSESQKALSNGVSQVTTSMAGQIDRMMKENSERLSKQVEELDKALGDELRKSLQSLSSQLVSLSGKFVSDYTPLTNQLKELVQIANKVKN